MNCNQCGQPIIFHALVDSEDWQAIAGGSYALCPQCMDQRFAGKGMIVECDIWYAGSAMTTRWDGRIERAGAWRQPEEIAIQGEGLPALFGNK